MSRRALGLALGCVLLAACSSTPPTARAPRPTISPGSTPVAAVAVRTPLQLQQLRDRASHVWTLGRTGSTTLVDLVPAAYPTRLVGKPPFLTSGPGGSTAARFQGAGRYVTPVSAAEVGPGRAFTVEFAFRSDDCTRHWSHVLGTGVLTTAGRQGLSVLHYPATFSTPCRMAFEFWKDGAYKGGCSTPNPLADGQWELYAMTFDGATATCFNQGRKVGMSQPGLWTSPLGQDFGIGGAPAGYGGSLDSGSLADVALYRNALTPAQIALHARLLAAT